MSNGTIGVAPSTSARLRSPPSRPNAALPNNSASARKRNKQPRARPSSPPKGRHGAKRSTSARPHSQPSRPNAALPNNSASARKRNKQPRARPSSPPKGKARRQAEHEHVAALAAEHRRREFKEHEAAHEPALDAERAGVPSAEEQISSEMAARLLTPSAQRDLDEIERWREEDDRKAAAKAARTRSRVSARLYKRQEDAYAAAQQPAHEAEEHTRRAEEDRRAALEAEEARRAAERQRAKEEELEALHRAEEERNKALDAERAERLAAERQRAQEAEATPEPWTAYPDHMAALNAERHALELKREELRRADKQEAQQAPDPPDERSDEKPSRLADLPLYSWANANEDEDKAPAEPD